MRIEARGLPGLADVILDPFEDHRGWLMRGFDHSVFAAHGLPTSWRQMIVSHTEHAGTVRGLHIQTPPFTEAKLILPLSGRMFWVAVDLRADSPTRGRWESVVLDPAGRRALFVPRGCAHGCLSLTGNVTLTILTDNEYSPGHGVGIAWDDSDIAIDWPLAPDASPILSADHARCPPMSEVMDSLRFPGMPDAREHDRS